MEAEDTTTSTVQDTVQAQAIAQPEELGTQAVQSEESTSTQDTTTEAVKETADNSESAELLDWASKKGIKTDDQIAMLKMMRESERKMHETSQEAKQLRESFDTIGQEQGLDDTSLMLNRLSVTDFYLNNPNARQYDDEMAQIVKDKPFLANDLETVYKLARFNSIETEKMSAKQEVQKETLAQVARAEVAAPPQASASTRANTPSEITDADVAKMSLSEYQEWKKNSGFNPFS